MSEADTVTAADVSGLNQAVVTRAANLARLTGTGLLVVAGLGVLSWAWVTLRSLDLLVGASSTEFDDAAEFGIADRIDLVAGYFVLLIFASVAAGLGVALRLAADYTVARTGGSLTGAQAGEPLASVRRRALTTSDDDGDEDVDGEAGA